MIDLRTFDFKYIAVFRNNGIFYVFFKDSIYLRGIPNNIFKDFHTVNLFNCRCRFFSLFDFKEISNFLRRKCFRHISYYGYSYSEYSFDKFFRKSSYNSHIYKSIFEDFPKFELVFSK